MSVTVYQLTPSQVTTLQKVAGGDDIVHAPTGAVLVRLGLLEKSPTPSGLRGKMRVEITDAGRYAIAA